MTTEFDTINAEKELKTAFEVFDKEMRGWIDEAELRRCLTTIGDCLTDVENLAQLIIFPLQILTQRMGTNIISTNILSPLQVSEFLHEADQDGDGCINYLEFVKIMTQESLKLTGPNSAANHNNTSPPDQTSLSSS
eukprot:sb/3474656/